jgi:hypothetical protein
MAADMTGVTSITTVANTVFGNKRIMIADLHIGDGTKEVAAAGIPLTPAEFGLMGIEYMDIESASLVYKFDYSTNAILAYTAHATPGATVKLIIADAAVPHETVRCMVVGYGLSI